MVSDDGKVTLFDFGGAKIQHEMQSYVILAKAGYSPIEQLQSTDEIGPWSDVYAMAATIYYCLCGHIPIESTRRVAGRDPLLKPSQEGVKITPRQEQVLLKGLALRYKDRYLSMAAFRDALVNREEVPMGKSTRPALLVIPLAIIAFVVVGVLVLKSINSRKLSENIEIESETESGKKIETETETVIETELETETESETETEFETETESETETELETETESETETELETEAKTETEAETELETEKETQLETFSEIESERDADDIIQDYNLGLLSYNEAAAQIENGHFVNNGTDMLDQLRESKEAYRKGNQYAGDNNTIKEAIEQYKNVIQEDVNYEDAQEQILSLRQLQIDTCRMEVETFKAENNFEEALDCIRKAQGIVPDSNDLSKLWRETAEEYTEYAFEQADELAALGDYARAVSILQGAYFYTEEEGLLDKIDQVTRQESESESEAASKSKISLIQNKEFMSTEFIELWAHGKMLFDIARIWAVICFISIARRKWIILRRALMH